MIHRLPCHWLLFVLLALLPGCAAVFDGTKDEITFTSEPQGVEVLVDATAVGITPCTVNVSKRVREVTFRRGDHSERRVPVEASWGFGWFLMDVLFTPGFGLSGILVDGISGAWMNPQANVHCDFTKPPPEPKKPAKYEDDGQP